MKRIGRELETRDWKLSRNAERIAHLDSQTGGIVGPRRLKSAARFASGPKRAKITMNQSTRRSGDLAALLKRKFQATVVDKNPFFEILS